MGAMWVRVRFAGRFRTVDEGVLLRFCSSTKPGVPALNGSSRFISRCAKVGVVMEVKGESRSGGDMGGSDETDDEAAAATG